MNKKKLSQRKTRSKNRKIRRKEQEDSTGIKRKSRNDKKELSPLVFYSIKAILLILMIISYFSFSMLLLPLFIGFTSLYYFSFWTERKINRNFNIENKKRVFKSDSALAFITILISIFSTIFTTINMIGHRRNTFSSTFQKIMSLSTGIRNKNNKSFGMGTKPEGFVPPSGSTGGRPIRTDFDISDLPIEFAFTQILSTILQILIFSVILLGFISTITFFYKKYVKQKRIKIKENMKNDWTFSKDNLKRILQEDV